LAVAFGAATILPDLIVKIDYGRWLFAITFYYVMILIIMLLEKDPLFLKHFNRITGELKRRPILCMFLLIYPFLFIPYQDMYISDFTKDFVNLFIKPENRVF
jgi:hypothetical protein